MKKIILAIIIISVFLVGCFCCYIIGLNQNIDQYHEDSDILPYGSGSYKYNDDGTWSYTRPKEPNYPTWYKHIDPQISIWENEKIGWSNGTQQIIFPLDGEVYIDGNFVPYFGTDNHLEGYVKNVSYSEIVCKVYDVQFVFMEKDSNGKFKLVDHINKTCLVLPDLFDALDNLWTWDRHRVYYEETNNPDFWIICGVYEWVLGFENGDYD